MPPIRFLVPPLTISCAPPFRFTQNTFLEHHVTTRQHTITEKGSITVKETTRLKFSRFFAKFLATNCCTVHRWDAIISLINTPLRMCRGIGMQVNRNVTDTSLVILTWNNTWKHFFKRPAVFFCAHSRFFRLQSVAQPEIRGYKGISSL